MLQKHYYYIQIYPNNQMLNFFNKDVKRTVEHKTLAQELQQSETQKRSCDCGCGCNSHWSDSLLFGQFSKKTASGLSAWFAAVNLISNAIAQAPIYVKERAENKNTIVEDHYIIDLFNDMRMNRFIVFKQLINDIIYKGNAYLYIKRTNGKPSKLIYLQPSQVSIVYNQLDDDLKYLVSSNKNVKRTVLPDDILHFYMWSRDGVNGVSLLNYGQRVVDLANAAEQTAKQFFDSGCQITGVLSFNGRVTDEQKQKIRTSWNAIHSGDSGSGLAILEGDSKFEKIAANSQEAQLLETRNYNTTEIARLFNISPILLGDLSHTSYADIEQAQLEFVTHTLLPYIIMFETEIDRKLLKSERTRFFDIDETSQLKGTKNALATYLSTLVSNGIMTINEARRILELNAIDGGDELIIPYTKIQDNTINEENNNNDGPDGTDDIKLQDDTAE